MRKPPGDGVAHTALATTPAAPPVRGDDAARQHRTIWGETLSGNDEAKLVEPGELGQVRASEGSVRHVEVLWMGSVGTPIIRGPRRLPDRRPHHRQHTLICDEPENFAHFIAPDASRAELRAALRRRHGLPDDDPDFWRGISARPAFDRITEPVLMVHGRYDDTCPPRWARATQRALTRAGVDSTLEWYDDGHAFGPAFDAAMDRTATFLLARMPG